MSKRPNIAEMTDAQLSWRYNELAYHCMEVMIDPDHPVSRMHGARWRREFKQVQQACERRGLFADESNMEGES